MQISGDKKKEKKIPLHLIMGFYGISVVCLIMFIMVLGYAMTGIINIEMDDHDYRMRHPAQTAAQDAYQDSRDKESLIPFNMRHILAKITNGILFEKDSSNPLFFMEMERSGIVKGYGCGEYYEKVH